VGTALDGFNARRAGTIRPVASPDDHIYEIDGDHEKQSLDTITVR
jgi:hypothetical protein